MNTVIYIDDQAVDISPKTVIATSIKKIDIGDLSGRWINYTNRFKLPRSRTNEQIFGLAGNENVVTSIPYSLLPAKLVQNGVEIIPRASMILRNSGKEYELNLYENSKDFFKSIDGLTLRQLACITNSGWQAADIDGKRNSTSGIISAVVYWLQDASTIFHVNAFLPSFYYHTFITSILEYTGLTISGDILTDARFTDLVIPYPGDKFEYPEDSLVQNYQNSDSFQFFSVLSTDTLLLFNYTSVLDYNIQVTVTANANASALTLNDGTYLRFIVRLNTVTVTSFDITGTGVTVSVSPLVIVEPGDVLDLIVTSNAPTTGVNATMSMVVFNIDQTALVDRGLVNWNLLLGEISCEDLLKDFFTRFAVVHKLQGNTLHLKTIESIINDRANALDWSGKLLDDVEEIDFSSEYAQNNYFEYEESDDEIAFHTYFIKVAPTLGRGNIVISNTAFEASKTIYKSPFKGSATFQSGSYNVAHIPVYLSTSSIYKFDVEPGLRLLTLKARNFAHNQVAEPAITFDSIARTDFKMGYFVDASKTKDTGWQYFLSQFYLGLTRALQSPKAITKSVHLTEQDISEYDPFKMVFDGRGYYLVGEIPNFIPGKKTTVELIKVG